MILSLVSFYWSCLPSTLNMKSDFVSWPTQRIACITIHCQKWIIKWICAILKLGEFGFFTISKISSSPLPAFASFEWHNFCPTHNFLNCVDRLLTVICIWCCKSYVVSKAWIDDSYLCILECIPNSFFSGKTDCGNLIIFESQYWISLLTCNILGKVQFARQKSQSTNFL